MLNFTFMFVKMSNTQPRGTFTLADNNTQNDVQHQKYLFFLIPRFITVTYVISKDGSGVPWLSHLRTGI